MISLLCFNLCKQMKSEWIVCVGGYMRVHLEAFLVWSVCVQHGVYYYV